MKTNDQPVEEKVGKKIPNYFKPTEFACKCGCGSTTIDPRLLEMLNKARDYAGIPFVITSGVRCKAHNKSIGGVTNSPHIGGYAADISAVDSRSKYLIVKAALHVGFNRVGVGKNFVHVDVDDRANKPQDVLWVY